MKIGLIGNPNVGKSTIFNALTGMHQKTGNWPGKTVGKAIGYKTYNNQKYEIVDLPGTYSLYAHSKEEEVTRNFVFFENYDALVIICDATSLERNLNLVIQILEITSNVVICINLLDEAKKKKIEVDINKLSECLKVPVIPVIARKKKGLNNIFENINKENTTYKIKYDYLEEIEKLNTKNYVALKFLLGDYEFIKKYDSNLLNKINIKEEILKKLNKKGIQINDIETIITEKINEESLNICKRCVKYNNLNYDKKERYIDRFLTNKITGIPIMITLLFIILYLTITISNYPSDFLYTLFSNLEKPLYNLLNFLPDFFQNMITYGIYHILTWVIAVMLPPMLIFFPLFTILEDYGLLPRIAFNLDKTFQKCGTCGKQGLTMLMGFGCNAVGVSASRIIDSKRERLISILTNSFMPCNGRFPLLISIITMFITENPFNRAIILLTFILLSVIMTFLTSFILSKTILKGETSSFTLELPPYRRPDLLKVITVSLIDRTWNILKKTIYTVIPVGIIIFLLTNITINNQTILNIITNALNPLGNLIGLDGVILTAFILGLPANEIVIPIMIMGYMSLNVITDISDLSLLKNLFINNNWTYITAINTIIFSLFHFPCLTTLLTIKKESNLKMVILSIIIPLIIGITITFSTYHIKKLFDIFKTLVYKI